jgi:hypothetical protein
MGEDVRRGGDGAINTSEVLKLRVDIWMKTVDVQLRIRSISGGRR